MIHYTDDTNVVHHGDSLNVLTELPTGSIDAVITDPPYGLQFMAKAWDDFRGTPLGACEECGNDEPTDGYRYCTDCMEALGGERTYTDTNNAAFQRWCAQWGRECLRVLKPGGHLLAFGGTRTWHRLTTGLEDAGFDIRDSIAWLYASGFPKSLDVGQALDRHHGATRTDVYATRRLPDTTQVRAGFVGQTYNPNRGERPPTRDHEYLRPVTDDARRWDGWGTALKPAFEPIVVARKPFPSSVAVNVLAHGTGALNIAACRVGDSPRARTASTGEHHSTNASMAGPNTIRKLVGLVEGRWPTNVVIDDTQAPLITAEAGTDAASFFPTFHYSPKAPTAERLRVDGTAHPTVKPLALMRWLVRLATPPGGTVLEPFAGSGTTVEACILEDRRCVAIEREADYLPLITQRIHRRRDPVAFVRNSGEDPGLFALLDPDPT